MPVHNAPRMTSDHPSEIRCPSCGRTTPFAPYCTHCGAVVHEGAGGARPHAMDREELDERIRQRRVEGFRRGGTNGEEERESDAWAGGRQRQSFVPEPADQLARHEAADAEQPPRVDYFDERAARQSDAAPEWEVGEGRAGVAAGLGGIPGAAMRPDQVAWPPHEQSDEPADARESGAATGGTSAGAVRAAGIEVAQADAEEVTPHAYEPPEAYDPDGYDPDGYGGGEDPRWTGYDDGGPRRRSTTLSILGLVVLGVAALLGGAFVFAALNARSPVGQLSSSASATASPSASVSESSTPTLGESPSGTNQPTGVPVPDNFSAKVQPCASSKMGFSGCVEDGSSLSGNQVWVWVGFKNGGASNVLGVTIVSKATKAAVGDGSLELDQLNGCDPGKTCSGYMTMTFGNLDRGSYDIRVTKDGAEVAKTSFTVGA